MRSAQRAHLDDVVSTTSVLRSCVVEAVGFSTRCTRLVAGAGGNGAIVPGSPSDPRSPAYFQQAIGDRLAKALLAGEVRDGDTVRVDRDPAADTLTVASA